MSYHPDTLDRRDPELIARVLPFVEQINRSYFRLKRLDDVTLPKGPVMFVANHNSGMFGPDLLCTFATLWRALGAESHLYGLAHDFVMRQFTQVGRVIQRFGALSATPQNAENVLRVGGQILVYPGGDLEAFRHSRRQHEVVILPRTGFVKVAQKLGVPIVPIVTEGAHRSAYIFSEGEEIARLLRLRTWARLQRFPLALALPWVFVPGPWLPYLPLPFPIQMRLLPAFKIDALEDANIAAHKIQTAMQDALSEMAKRP